MTPFERKMWGYMGYVALGVAIIKGIEWIVENI